MAKKEPVKVLWESDPQSSKKLKGKVLDAGGIGLDLAGGGRAPGYAHVDDMRRFVVPSKHEDTRRIIAEQKSLLLQVLFAFCVLLHDVI